LYEQVVVLFLVNRGVAKDSTCTLYRAVPVPVGCIKSVCSAPLRPQCAAAAVQGSVPLRTFVPLIWTIWIGIRCCGYPLWSRDTCFVSYVTYRSHAVPAYNLSARNTNPHAQYPTLLCGFYLQLEIASLCACGRPNVLTWPNYRNLIEKYTRAKYAVCAYLSSLR
jgi:hypothetical protein